MTVQFRLEGPSLTIGALNFGDTLAQDSTKLTERKQDLLNKPYSRFSIELFEFEQIRPLYLSAVICAYTSPRPSPASSATPISPCHQTCPSKFQSIPAPSSGFRE